jgi:peroxiredoxin
MSDKNKKDTLDSSIDKTFDKEVETTNPNTDIENNNSDLSEDKSNKNNKKGLYIGALGVALCAGAGVFYNSANKTNKEYENSIEVIENSTVELDFTNKTSMQMRDYYTLEGEEFIKKIFPDSLSSDFALLNVGKSVDKELKDVVFTTVDNTEIKLSDLKGKKVVIDFAMASCSVCQGELEFMSNYDYKSEDIEYLHLFPLDSTPDVKTMFDENNGKYDKKHIVSQTGLNGFTIEDVGITNVPAKLFIDENGVIQYAYVGGFNDKETMELHLDRAFGKDTPKMLDFLRSKDESSTELTDAVIEEENVIEEDEENSSEK